MMVFVDTKIVSTRGMLRQNDIAGEQPKNQPLPDRRFRTSLEYREPKQVLTPSPTSPTISFGALTRVFHLSCHRSFST